MKVRELIRELLDHGLNSDVYVGKGMGPLEHVVSEVGGNTGTDRLFVILSPAKGSADLSGVQDAIRADERRKCAAEIRAAAKEVDTLGMLTLVRASMLDAADVIDPPSPSPDREDSR
jgi:hypothetical protein